MYMMSFCDYAKAFFFPSLDNTGACIIFGLVPVILARARWVWECSLILLRYRARGNGNGNERKEGRISHYNYGREAACFLVDLCTDCACKFIILHYEVIALTLVSCQSSSLLHIELW